MALPITLALIALAVAAFWIASTIRPYVPQRQMLPFMWRTTSSGCGGSPFSSKATADMIIPGVQ